MLASLRPRFPPALAVDSPSHHPSLSYSSHFPDRVTKADYQQMEGSGPRRYVTPPPGSVTGAEPLDQRPSPQSRQRTWHHPYMHPPRGSQGPSPPMPLESAPGPSTLPYDMAHHDYPSIGPRQRSPPQHRNELLHAAHEARPDMLGRSQPLNISALPTYPHSHNVERVGGIGPNRNRGRSSTLTLPRPETTRLRGGSFVGGRHHSPSHGAGHDEPVPPPRSWEDARSWRGPYPHPPTEGLMAHRHSPTFRPPSRQSPILFAALSPNQDAHLHAQRRVSGQMPAKLVNAGALSRGGQYRSRPGTPISPLNMDSLSMEETSLPSASGMAVPLVQAQQRSPADARVRGDYFGPSAAERNRSHHGMAEMPGSPRSGAYVSGPRMDPRDYAHRGPGHMHGEAISPDTETPRYPPGSHAGAPSHMHMGRGPAGPMSAHHSGMSRMEQFERDRFAMAQHHGPGPGAYMGGGGPQEPGYQSEFAHQARLGPGGGYAGSGLPHAVPVDRIAHSRRRRRPPYSYSSMITQAISSSSEGRMTLREIYTWISSNFSGYPMSGPDSQGWQNTVRHNLSLGKIFIKKARTAQDIYDSCSSGNPSQSQAARGKGGWWTLHPVVLAQIRSGQRTHNDEFDDVERLVEIENAAASSGAALGSAAMAATSSAVSADGAVAASRVASGELSQTKTLSRQRSYSDSMDPNAAEQRRAGSGQQSVTAPVSRKGSIGANRNTPAGRSGYAPYAAQLAERKSISGPGARDDMPSVLQPKVEVDSESTDRPGAYGRVRGHTIAVHDTSSQQHHRTSAATQQHDLDRYDDDEAYMRTRPSFKLVSSPRPLFQARTEMVEDVDMELAGPAPRDSSLVLQEARDTLVSSKHQQQHQHLHRVRRESDSSADSQEGKGRMAIRGLLNS